MGNTELSLNGAGVRTRLDFQVYVIGQYLPAISAGAVLASRCAKRIRDFTVRSRTGEQLAEALSVAVAANRDIATLRELEPRIARLRAAIIHIGDVADGAWVLRDYLPEAGTRLAAAGKPQGSDSPAEDLFTAVLRIWLDDAPIQDDLKQQLTRR